MSFKDLFSTSVHCNTILSFICRHLTVEWKAGVFECKVFKFAQMFSLYLSAYIMVLIGVDRFIGKFIIGSNILRKPCHSMGGNPNILAKYLGDEMKQLFASFFSVTAF